MKEEVIVEKSERLENIYSKLERAGIDHKRLAVSNLLALFAQLLIVWRANPKKFKKNLSELRDNAIKPYKDGLKNRQLSSKQYNEIHENINLINLTYTHIVEFVVEQIDPKIDEYEHQIRKQRTEDIEWIARSTGTVSKNILTGGFKHGVPATMIAVGATNLIKISTILGMALDTINTYSNDPFGRCNTINQPNLEYKTALNEYKDTVNSYWFSSFRNLDIQKPTMTEREIGFFTTLTDSVLCTVPQWTTGVAGNVFTGVAEISGATASVFSAFIILLLGVVLWLFLNKNSDFGISFLAYFKFTDPQSTAPASAIQYIQNIAPAITSGIVSPPKNVIKEIKRIENAANKAYDKKIGTSSSPEKIQSATRASINVMEEQSKRVSPLAKIILQSEINEKREEIKQISLKKLSPKRKLSPKNPSLLESILNKPKLKPVGERKLKSPPKKKSPTSIFNTNLISRRQFLADEEKEEEEEGDWNNFGKRKSKRKSRKSKRKSRKSKRKSRRSKIRSRK